jgi:hypothetical protein
MPEELLLNSCSGDPMSCSINDIIESGHHIKEAIFIEISCISCCIIPWRLFQILLDEGFIIVIESEHERWRKRKLDTHFSQLVMREFLVVVVQDLHLETWRWFSSTSWFRFESVQVAVVTGDYPTALGLPVVVVY